MPLVAAQLPCKVHALGSMRLACAHRMLGHADHTVATTAGRHQGAASPAMRCAYAAVRGGAQHRRQRTARSAVHGTTRSAARGALCSQARCRRPCAHPPPQAVRSEYNEEVRKAKESAPADQLCATPFGVDVVGITEFIALTGALVGGEQGSAPLP